MNEKPKYELAYEDYLLGMKYKDIAEKYEVSVGTVNSWKSRYWNQKSMHRKPKKPMHKKNLCIEKETHPKTSEKRIIKSVEQNEELTNKQKLFCLYYIRSFNATMSYMKAYECSYDSARVEGCNTLTNPNIKNEIKRLKEIKNQSIMGTGDDVVEIHMRIAFADLTDYADFECEQVPVLDSNSNPIMVEDNTEDIAGIAVSNMKPKTIGVNVLNLKLSNQVDGQLLSKISVGKSTSIEMADRHKSLAFLERYFELNPMDKHKREYDNKRLELELLEIERTLPTDEPENNSENSLMDILEDSAKRIWVNE